LARNPNLLDAVESAIRDLLDRGLPLSGAVERFLHATWGTNGWSGLQDVLEVAEDAERDTLQELLFFPDRRFQAALEETLNGTGVPSPGSTRLKARLVARPPIASFTDAAGRILGRLALPGAGAGAFVDRLNLTWCVKPDLLRSIQALDEAISGPPRQTACRLLVGLRNARLTQTDGQIQLLSGYLACRPSAGALFEDGFDFLMGFLAEHPQHADLYAALMERKRFLFRHLTQARRAAALFQQHNMETLIQMGFRAAHFDIPQAERTMDLIDAVALAVYGRTEPLEGRPHRIDLGRADKSGDALFKLLS
jgi:hypothetical protein